MTRIRGNVAALVVVVLAVAMLTAGCGSTASQPSSAAVAAPLSATTAATTPGGTWAVVPMGGTGPNLFWQLFRFSGTWSLRTPPDIATNGALILAPRGGPGSGQDAGALAVGIRPSLDLSFAPVTSTSDGGRAWSTLAPASGLADVPDAMAAAPDGHLLALDDHQQVSEYGSGPGSGWSTLASRRAVAATPAGRQCALTSLTAVAYGPGGMPLAGGACGQSGVAGIFGYSSGTWHLAGPSLPASLAGLRIEVLRLTRAGDTDTALLEAGSGTSAVLAVARTAGATGAAADADGDADGWTVSPVLRLAGAQVSSASFGQGGAVGVILTGDRADVLEGPRSSWRALPELPVAHSVTLAMPAAGETEVLAASGSDLTVWKLASSPARWHTAQAIKVPIAYGSSS